MSPHSPGRDSKALRAGYDRVADEYVRRIAGELAGKPFDCELLDRFAAEVRPGGWVCDLGCGPGHVGCYLADRGARVCGIDLSHGLLTRARALHLGIPFVQGDLRSLGIRDGALAAIVAFYSIIHLEPSAVPEALREMTRVLEPGGRLVLAFHVGDDVLHLDAWWGEPVCIDFVFYRTMDVVAELAAAGFEAIDTRERDPYPEVEHPSRRAYVTARKPAE